MKRIAGYCSASIAALVLLAPMVVAQDDWGGYGPYDYTNPVHYRDKLPVVEKYHWNANVASGQRGVSVAFAASDLEYIIRAFPNHHPALEAMSRQWRTALATTRRAPMGANPEKTPEYWFDRAIKFAPHDGMVHLIYGVHLLKTGSRAAAGEHFDTAVRLNPDSADVHYNVGLYYLEANKPEEALTHAWKAYELGYPLPGLRNRLMSKGAWRDPPGDSGEPPRQDPDAHAGASPQQSPDG